MDPPKEGSKLLSKFTGSASITELGQTPFYVHYKRRMTSVLPTSGSQPTCHRPLRARKRSNFFRGWFTHFCWGFWQKRGAERGFSMVNLWWIAGKSW
jgi:hypothetical protein